jgi:AcrR family transcriptional regulator
MSKSTAKTKEALLQAGLELFGKYGYSFVTVKQVSEYTGINSALISYHFGGKENYYVAVVRYGVDKLIAWFQEFDVSNLEELSKEELQEKIHAGLKLFLSWYCHPDGINSLYIYYRDMIVGDNQAALAEYNRSIDGVGAKYIKLLSTYYQKIDNQTTNPEFILLSMVSFVHSFVIHHRGPSSASEQFSDAKTEESLLKLMLNGI